MTDEDVPGTVVFDAEPLVAYFCDEPGSDTVETYLEAVEGTADGYISAVTLAEVHCISDTPRHSGTRSPSGPPHTSTGRCWSVPTTTTTTSPTSW